jgi:hypothetical protein
MVPFLFLEFEIGCVYIVGCFCCKKDIPQFCGLFPPSSSSSSVPVAMASLVKLCPYVCGFLCYFLVLLWYFFAVFSVIFSV